MLGSEFFLSLHSLPERAILGAPIGLVDNLVFRTPSRDVTPRDDVIPRVVTSLEFRTTSDDFRVLSPLLRARVESGILLLGRVPDRETRRVLVMTGEFVWVRERRELSIERRLSIRLTAAGFWQATGGGTNATSSEKGSSSRGKVGEGAETTDMELSHRSTNRPVFSLQLLISFRLGISNMDRGTESDTTGIIGAGSDMFNRMLSIVSSISVSSGSTSFAVSWSETIQIVRFIWCFLGS